MARAPKRKVRVFCPRCRQPRQAVNPAWLRWVREEAGWSLRGWAAQLCVSPAYLSDIERGRRLGNEGITGRYLGLWEATRA
jgi:ribosome-binding protein aMBF1 (putative translation factor)